MSMDNSRIMKELKELVEGAKNATAENRVVQAETVGNDMRHWKGKIFGPVSSIALYHITVAV